MLQVAGKPIQGVAFDLEETVIDFEPLHFAAHVEAAKALGITLDLDDPDTFTKDVPHFIGGPHEAIIDELLALAQQRETFHPTTEEGRQRTFRELSKFDHKTFRTLKGGKFDYQPRDGFLEFFQQLRSADTPVAIGSLTDDADAWDLLEKSGLNRLFDRDNVILRGDVSKVKPDPEVYQKTAERMGIMPSQQLVFEDSHNGIRAAREAGSVAVGMPTIYRPEIINRMHNEGAVLIFGNWRQVNFDTLRSKEGQSRPLEGRPPSRRERL